MTDDDYQVISVADLRSIYAEAPAITRGKLAYLDTHCRTWIELSRLVFVATTDADGNCDVSPKGGPPGFVKVLDDTHVGWADLSGSNKLDGMQNLISSNGIAMVFLVLGVSEVLRVNGRAPITTDPAIAQRVAIWRAISRVSIVCEVKEAWLHCGKALRRSSVCDSTQWSDTSQLASYGQIIKDHGGLHAVTAEALDAALQKNYETHQWLPVVVIRSETPGQ